MDKVSIYSNERMDVSDMRDIAGQLIVDELIRRTAAIFLPSGRDSNVPQTDCRVLAGFDVVGTPVGGTDFELTQGSALCKILDDGVLKHGVTLGDQDPSTYTIDMSGLGDDTYNIWARCVFGDSSTENRIFWNPTGSPATETVSSVATRQAVTWELVAVSSSGSPPGHGEYFRIYQVVIASSVISTVTDQRAFYFEGEVASSPAYDHEWGDGANDRNADRATYGVKDMHMFIHMILRQLSEIIDKGAATPQHYVLPGIGLAQLAPEHKSNGAHGDVDCDTLDCAGQATAESVVIDSSGTAGLKAIDATADDVEAVKGTSDSGDAVYGISTSGSGVRGHSSNGLGVEGNSFGLSTNNNMYLIVPLSTGMPQSRDGSTTAETFLDWQFRAPGGLTNPYWISRTTSDAYLFFEILVPQGSKILSIRANVTVNTAGLTMRAQRINKTDVHTETALDLYSAATWMTPTGSWFNYPVDQNQNDVQGFVSTTSGSLIRITFRGQTNTDHYINGIMINVDQQNASFLQGKSQT